MTFNHQQTDHVPLNYLGTSEINHALMQHFSIEEEQSSPMPDYRRLLFDFVGSDSKSYNDLLNKLHIDFRLIRPEYTGPNGKEFNDPDMIEDIYGCTHKKVKYPTHTSYELFSSPLAEANNIKEVDVYPWWPQADWFDYSVIAGRCAERSQYALVAGKSDLMGAGAFLQGIENFLMGLVTDNPGTISILDHLTEFYLNFNRHVFESAKGRLDIAWYGDDYGTQRGLLMGIPTWRKHMRPRLLKLIELAKSYDLKVMLHSCGSIRELIPDLIDVGIDIIDTLQPEAAGMEPGELKRCFGDKISFHGSISTAGVLANGSVEDVKKEVLERIQVMAPGGGFCLAPTHTIMPGTPIENVLAMYESALERRNNTVRQQEEVQENENFKCRK